MGSSNLIRLQKFLQRCGVASRRKSEKMIRKGMVKVNGEIIQEMGYKVNPQKDIVELNGKKLKVDQRKVYILLNKPKYVITSVKDDRGRKTVMEFIKVKERIFPVGRLDYDTEGLILLTNDGELAHNLTHPSYGIEKVYEAEIEGLLTESEIKRLKEGVELKGGYKTAKANIRIIKTDEKSSRVEVKITEGKKRQVKRMFKAVGHAVKALKRQSIGPLTLKGIEHSGAHRFLSEEEINVLQTYIKKKASSRSLLNGLSM